MFRVMVGVKYIITNGKYIVVIILIYIYINKYNGYYYLPVNNGLFLIYYYYLRIMHVTTSMCIRNECIYRWNMTRSPML